MGIFDSKFFNPEVFLQYLETVPNVKQNALLQAGILRTRNDLKAAFNDQLGGNFAAVPMVGRLSGAAQNYDGTTNVEPGTLGSFLQNMIVVGRMRGWQEKDFTFDMTKHDFMEDIAAQVVEYWQGVDQATMLNTLAGVFAATANTNSFASKHTLDISADTNPNVGATTLNSAIAKASGANKGIFTAAIMHSAVATNLENLQVLEYRKYTDPQGFQREVAIADWNGRVVLVDDEVPTEAASSDTKYTTYLLGEGAFDYVDCGAKVPVETMRDAKTSGGIDILINRQRKIFAPRGFNFVQPTTPVVSPTNEQLATGGRWALVKDGAGNFIDDRIIPIARIISKG